MSFLRPGRRARSASALPAAATVVLAFVATLAGAAPAHADEVLRGELRAVVTDRFAHGESETAWVVDQRDGNVQRFRPTDPTATLRRAAGREVEVTTSGPGAVPRGTITEIGAPEAPPQNTSPDEAGPDETAPQDSPARGVAPRADEPEPTTRSVVIVPLETDLPGAAPSKAELERSWAQLDDYWRQQSSGRQALRVEVRDPVAVRGEPYCHVQGVERQLEEAAPDSRVDLGSYDHVVIVPEQNPACGSLSGMAYHPGRYAFIDGPEALSVVVHELGHNLGLWHANILHCTRDGEVVATGGTCQEYGYGDPFDAMGNKGAGLFQGFNRQLLGVYREHPEQVASATTDGTYTVDSVNTPGGADVLLVDRPGRDLSVELRTPASPFDAFAPFTRVTEGVLLRLVGRDRDTTLLRAGAASGLTSSVRDDIATPLPAGGEFVDPEAGLRLHVDAVGGGQATVTVAYGTPDSRPPTAPELTVSRDEGLLTARWTAAEDNLGVTRYELDGFEERLTLGPSEREVVRTVPLDGGRRTFTVAAFDAAGNKTKSNVVVDETPDRIAPGAPTGLRADLSESWVNLSWDQPTEPDVRWDVTVDGGPHRTGAPTPQEWVARDGRTSLLVGVTAVDQAGNRSAEVTLRVDVPPVETTTTTTTTTQTQPTTTTDPTVVPPTFTGPTGPTTPIGPVGPTGPVGPKPPGPKVPPVPGGGGGGRGTTVGPGDPAAKALKVTRGGARFTVAPWSTASKTLRVTVARKGWRVTQLRVLRDGRQVVRCRARATCTAPTTTAASKRTRFVLEARLERPATRSRPAVRRTTKVTLRVSGGRLVVG